MLQVALPIDWPLSQAIQQKAICVTCNYEARAFGVHKLQRIAEAKRMCPRLVLVSGEDLTPFRAVSSAVFELIRSAFTPHVQRLGMDEVFLDVSDAVDALEAGCPLEPPSTPSLPWAGFVFAGQPHAKATVERQVPLAALAHGWSTGRGALAALAAAAGNAGSLGDAGSLPAATGSSAARSAEPAWSRYARARPSAAAASSAAPAGAADAGGCAEDALAGRAAAGAAPRSPLLPQEEVDPEPSDAVPCPDASARWAPTPVTLVPVGAAPGRAEHRLRLASALAARIRFAVASRLGIRCCAGVGTSKLAAKFAVNLRKPASQSVLLPSGMPTFLASLRVQALPGVGHTATKRLRALAGVESVPQLLVAPRALVEEALGNKGLAARALSLARGIDDDPVKASGPPRTISDEDSFRALRGVARASAELRRIAADLLPRLDADAARFGRRPRALRVALRTDRERRQTRQQPFPDAALSAHVCSGAELARRRAAGSPAGPRASEESATAQDSRTAGQRSGVLAEAAERLALAAGLEEGVRITLLSVGAGNFSEPSRGVDSLGGQAAAGSLGSGAALTLERFLAQPAAAAESPSRERTREGHPPATEPTLPCSAPAAEPGLGSPVRGDTPALSGHRSARGPSSSPARPRPGPGGSQPARPAGACEEVWAALPLEVKQELAGSSQALRHQTQRRPQQRQQQQQQQRQLQQRKRPRHSGGSAGAGAKRPSLRGAAAAKPRPAARRGTLQAQAGGRRQTERGLLGYFAAGADL